VIKSMGLQRRKIIAANMRTVNAMGPVSAKKILKPTMLEYKRLSKNTPLMIRIL
jgi:hypothetical protein